MSLPSLTTMDLADINPSLASQGGSKATQGGGVKPNISIPSKAGRKQFAAILAAQDHAAQDPSSQEGNKTNIGQQDTGVQTEAQGQTEQQTASEQGDTPSEGAQQAAQRQDGPEQTVYSEDKLVDKGRTHPSQGAVAAKDETLTPQEAAEARQKAEQDDDPSKAHQSSSAQTAVDLQAALSIAGLFTTHHSTAIEGPSSASASLAGQASIGVAGRDAASSLARFAVLEGQTQKEASVKAVDASMASVGEASSQHGMAEQAPASFMTQPMKQTTPVEAAFAQGFNMQRGLSHALSEGEQGAASVRLSSQAVTASQGAVSSVAQNGAQDGKQAVTALSFQPATMAAMSSTVKGPSSPSSVIPHGATHDDQTHAGSNTLFDLLVKSSAQTGGQSLSSGGEQGGAGHDGASEHNLAERAARTDIAAATHGDDAGKSGLNVGEGSFLGLVSSHMEGSNDAAQNMGVEVASSHSLPQHQAQQAGGEVKASLMQHNLATPSVLSARTSNGQAGTLNITVTTSDDTSVRVQLNRSPEGLSSLALQGQDDGTTDALQKTHHILARQLDEVGLHAGVMKIDVLPTEAGQGAHGGEQNMPQQQSPNQGQHQGQNQQGQATFQQAGGFLAGGDGGAGQQHTARQPRAILRAAQSEASPQDDTSYTPTGTAGGASGGMGRLNISV